MRNAGYGRPSQDRNLAAVEVDGGAVEPARTRRHHEADEVGHVLDGAEADDPGLAAKPLADRCLPLAGALDLGADAPPLPLGLNQARMNAVHPHAVLLAEVGETLAERHAGGVH